MDHKNDQSREFELIALIQKHKDRHAWEEIVKHYNLRITNYIRSMIPDPDIAVQLTQDTWMRVSLAIDRFNPHLPHSSFSAWIFRIAYNVTMNHIRHEQPSSGQQVDEAEADTEIASGEISFSDEITNRHLLEEFLDQQCREVLDDQEWALRALLRDGYSRREIEERLSVSEAWITNKLGGKRIFNKILNHIVQEHSIELSHFIVLTPKYAAELSREEYEIVHMHLEEYRPLEQICEQLKISVQQAQSILNQAIRKLMRL